jgi:NAD(P)H-dependent flavin oxidoreductase YrpB (nitropropane dioxygenase family)
MDTDFKNLNIGGLRIEVPIIQGGMGVGVSVSSLASAVSNEGGMGVIAAVGLGEGTDYKGEDYKTRSSQSLTDIIRKTRQLTNKPFGVNIMCALTNYDDLVRAAEEELIDVIISGAGLPLRLPSLVKNKKTELVPIVSSARAAYIICNIWKRRYKRLPDALIVEGPLAGGHLGYSREELADSEHFNLDTILKDVLLIVRQFETDSLKIPIVAAGGFLMVRILPGLSA